MTNTQINWTAYKVSYHPPCEAEEVIGYFQNRIRAELAKCEFMEERNLRENGICCMNSKWVTVEEITIIA